MKENTLLMQPTRAILKATPGLHFARKAGLATLALCMLSGVALAQRGAVPVSYTHLTLPTNREV